MGMPTFSKASVTTWTSEKGEATPYQRIPQRLQTATVSEDGTRQVADHGLTLYMIPITFRNISATNYAALVAFFSNALVNWAANAFTYTDYAGGSHSVTLEPDTFAGQMNANRYTVSMTLREVA